MTRLEKITVWGGTAAVAITGFVYAGMKYLMQPADEWAIVNHPLQPLVLKLHILAGPVLVFGIGLVAARHILPHLRASLPRGRFSGTAAAYLIVPMVLSGYLIQAMTHSTVLAVLGYFHLAAGALFACASIGHFIAARRRRQRATPAGNRPGNTRTATPQRLAS